MTSTTMLDIHKAQAHLSEHVAKLKPGARIILCRGNRAVAEILPIPEPTSQPRPIGLGKGLAEVPESFFDPLPGDILARFDGTVS